MKSILDIGRTLEYLETLGVCVATFGSTRQFPAFFTRDSGHLSACNVTDCTQAAQLIHTTFSLGLNNGESIKELDAGLPYDLAYPLFSECSELGYYTKLVMVATWGLILTSVYTWARNSTKQGLSKTGLCSVQGVIERRGGN